MTYAAHTLAQFGGRILTPSHPDEIWSCGIRLTSLSASGGEPATVNQAYANEVGPHLATWFATSTNGIPTAVKLDFLKVNEIEPTGRYLDKANTVVWRNNTGNTGGNSTQNAPSFCTLAYSWTTAFARGPASKGRVYLPNFSYSASGSFVSDTDQQKALVAAVALLEVFVNTSGTRQGVPVVASSINSATEIITGARVGDVYDTQRRRKNAYREQYMTGVLA